MQIKDLGPTSAINNALQKNGAKKQVGDDAFLKLMREKIVAEEATSAKRAATAEETGFATEIEAIAARARIMGSAPKNDVTAFLGLIRENRYILRGVELEGLSSGELKGELSAAQISELRAEFNIESLSPKDTARLFKKLNEMGVLSAEDIINTKISVTPYEGDLMDYLAEEAWFNDISAVSETNPAARLKLMLQNERRTAEHIKERYGQNTAFVSGLADSHERVLKVLEKI